LAATVITLRYALDRQACLSTHLPDLHGSDEEDDDSSGDGNAATKLMAVKKAVAVVVASMKPKPQVITALLI
jgi:hypothetical protein